MTSPIRAVIFDWAGTIVDFGSLAPVMAFAAAFEDARVPVTLEEIRKPMGLPKRDHIVKMFDDGEIRDRWRREHRADPTGDDIDALYAATNDRLIDLLPKHAEPIPGTLEAIGALRAAGVKIGSNSGYAAPLMEILTGAARAHGLVVDCVVSASDVSAPRPAPDLSFKCLELLELERGSVGIKVDDTGVGIEEGRNAGLWTVAVAVSGNAMGLSLAEWSALTPDEQNVRRRHAHEALRGFGPDYVVDSVADLADVVTDVERRVAAGERVLA